MTLLDTDVIRAQFPALTRTIAGRPIVFADAPGGTQVPQSVIDAMAGYLQSSNANEHGAFLTSHETNEVISSARRAAADFLGCDPGEVVFGPNMTSLAFALSRALARDLKPGDEIVVTNLDHDGNIAPWVAAAEDAGARVRWVDINPSDCIVDLNGLDAALSDNTRLVAFSLASNAVGTVTNAGEIVRRVRTTDAIIVADAVHYAPHRSIDVGALDVDVLFCSPYKFFGPHMGIMYARRKLLDKWRPYKVRPAPNESPARWETGTRNHEGLAGLIACIDYIASLQSPGEGRRAQIVGALQAITEHEEALSTAFLEGIARLQGIDLFGIIETARVNERTPTFALRIGGRSPAEVAKALAEDNVFVWDGNYYALAVMERLGLEESGGAVRVGFCHYHSRADVDYVLDRLEALT